MNASRLQDPVAASLEAFFQRQAAAGHGPFNMREHPGEVTARFSNITVRGETAEIALIRLARQLVDDERYGSEVIEVLREVLPT